MSAAIEVTVTSAANVPGTTEMTKTGIVVGDTMMRVTTTSVNATDPRRSRLRPEGDYSNVLCACYHN